MINSTVVTHFTFAAYIDIGSLKYFVFVILMGLYLISVFANMLLIVVICINRSLHEPMYLFLCSLFVNELIGSTGLLPLLMLQILADVHTIPVPLCHLQIFFLYIYANVQIYTLAVLSYDRYLAICCPLQYNGLMTPRKVAILSTFMWLMPHVVIAIMISLNASLQLCGNIIERLYCDNFSVVKLACHSTMVNNIYGLTYTVCVLFCLFLLILFSYIKILIVIFSGSKKSRQKAVSTCTPHLASLLNFSCGCFFEVIQSRFNMNGVPIMLRIFLSLYFIVCQPVFNPMVYGLTLTKIRIICKNLVFRQI